jgi:hypothetical protein
MEGAPSVQTAWVVVQPGPARCATRERRSALGIYTWLTPDVPTRERRAAPGIGDGKDLTRS